MSPGDKQFVCPPGTNIFHTQWGGRTFFTHSRGGDKHFLHTQKGGGQTFFVGASGGFGDVDGEIGVSEANISVSEASKLSAGARILGARRALKF